MNTLIVHFYQAPLSVFLAENDFPGDEYFDKSWQR